MNDAGAPSRAQPPLTTLEILEFRALVERHSGLTLDDRKNEALSAAVADLGGEMRLDSAQAVLEACRAEGGDAAPLLSLVSRLTIGETHFFRNRPHFRALGEVVFPELLERRAATKELRIWSAGCSTGEEPYTVAMTLRATADRLGIDLDSWRVRLLGTDIDRSALDKARAATYGRYSFRGVEQDEVARNFEPVGDKWRVLPRYSKLVEFQPFNLKLDPFPASGTFFHDLDLILCRNVTIYFSAETTQQVVDRFHESLAEGGYLLVGHSEHSLETYRRFQTRALPDVILYQRGGDREERPPVVAGVAPSLFAAPLRRAPLGFTLGRSRRLGSPDVPAAGPVRRMPPTALDEARDALAAGDRNRAANLAVEALERDHSDAEASLLLGQIAADRGHLAEARIWLERTLELKPLDLAAHFLLALLSLGEGDRTGALKHLDRALYVDGDLVMAHFLAARAHAGLGRAEAAERSLRAALRALDRVAPDSEVPFSEGLSSAQMRQVLVSQGAVSR